MLNFDYFSIQMIKNIVIVRGFVLLGPLLFSAADFHFNFTTSGFWTEISILFIGANFLKLSTDNFLFNKSAIKRFNVYLVLGFSFLILALATAFLVLMAFLVPTFPAQVCLGMFFLALLYLAIAFLRVHENQVLACLFDPNILFWMLLAKVLWIEGTVSIEDFVFFGGMLVFTPSLIFIITFKWSRAEFQDEVCSCWVVIQKFFGVLWWLYPVTVTNWFVGSGSIWIFNLFIPKEYQSGFFFVYRLLQSSKLLPALANFSIAPAISRLSELNENPNERDMVRFKQFKGLSYLATCIIGSLVVAFTSFFALDKFFFFFFGMALILEFWFIKYSHIINVLISFERFGVLMFVNFIGIGFMGLGCLFFSWKIVLMLFIGLSAIRLFIFSWFAQPYIEL